MKALKRGAKREKREAAARDALKEAQAAMPTSPRQAANRLRAERGGHSHSRLAGGAFEASTYGHKIVGRSMKPHRSVQGQRSLKLMCSASSHLQA